MSIKPDNIVAERPLETWRQHLLDAAAYMQEHGHCKGAVRSDSGAVCLLGAIRSAAPRSLCVEEDDAVYRHLNALGFYGFSMGRWNDRPETTKEMAVNALIAAALAK